MGSDPSAPLLHYEGIVAAWEALSQSYGEDAKPDDLIVVDYATYGSNKEQGLEGRHAFYLVNSSAVRGSADPLNAIAFATRRAAIKHQAKVGGEVMTFEDVWNAAAQFAAPERAADDSRSTRAAANDRSDSTGRRAPEPRQRRSRESYVADDCNT